MLLSGLFWIFREVHKAAQEEMDRQAEAITTELGELYRMLEAGKIPEAEFEVREKELLDRLEEVEGEGISIEEEAA